MIEMKRIITAMKSYYDSYDAPSPLDELVFEKLAQDVYSPNKDPFFEEEITLIESMNRNTRLIAEYNNCRNILKKMGADASTKRIHQELFDNVLVLGFDRMQLYHGNMLFFHALRASPHMHSPEQIDQYIDLFEGVPVMHSLSNLTTYSIIVQLYIALIYMRGDNIRDALNHNTPQKATAIQNVSLLFNHDIIRHLRNALAHGHIRPALTGLYFKDRNFEIIIPLRMAEELSQNLYGFYFVAFDKLNLRLFPDQEPPKV